jgi:chaperone BCS1
MDGDPNVVMFGLMSSMRTGNMIFDMAVCLLLPLVFRNLWQYFHNFYTITRVKVQRKLNRQYKRVIENTRSNRPWSGSKAAHKNRVLIMAIRQYIGRNIKRSYPVADIKLQSVKGKDAERGGTLVEQLEKKFHVVSIPKRGGDPIEIEPGLYFVDMELSNRQENEDGKKTSSVSVTTRLVFTTDMNGGRERVDAFIKKAYEWYVAEVEANEDHSYFMYQPLVTKATSSDDKGKSTEYKRYRLSGEKTFKSIFFPERDRVLRVLGHFADKSGKYSIPGFPHKLGLLLHGPPGTGKTSLVKAIAAHTKRHIISVPLSRIRTNQELMDVMFDQVFPHKAAGGGSNNGDDDDGGGEAGSNKHRIDEVVFLLEDVDAASKVVHARTDTTSPSKAAGKRRGSHAGSHVHFENGKNGQEDDDESTMTRQLSHALQKQASALGDIAPAAENEDGKAGQGEGDAKAASDPPTKKKSSWDDPDKLDLAGLLNVLDGVVDAPGRILVMTTNHPEKLDPALLRPGRVNLQIYMGFIQCPDAVKMVNHYYPNSAQAALDSVKEAFERKDRSCVHGLKMSPAEFEQLCAESDTIPQLVTTLDKYVPKR